MGLMLIGVTGLAGDSGRLARQEVDVRGRGEVRVSDIRKGVVQRRLRRGGRVQGRECGRGEGKGAQGVERSFVPGESSGPAPLSPSSICPSPPTCKG